jgi:hypothetical protein
MNRFSDGYKRRGTSQGPASAPSHRQRSRVAPTSVSPIAPTAQSPCTDPRQSLAPTSKPLRTAAKSCCTDKRQSHRTDSAVALHRPASVPRTDSEVALHRPASAPSHRQRSRVAPTSVSPIAPTAKSCCTDKRQSHRTDSAVASHRPASAPSVRFSPGPCVPPIGCRAAERDRSGHQHRQPLAPPGRPTPENRSTWRRRRSSRTLHPPRPVRRRL